MLCFVCDETLSVYSPSIGSPPASGNLQTRVWNQILVDKLSWTDLYSSIFYVKH